MRRNPPDYARLRCCAALLGAVSILMGCSDRDAESEAVAASARHLAAVGAGSLADGPYTYSGVAQEIGRLDTGEGTAAGVASGLLAQSRQGEGSLRASAAVLAERALFDEIDQARTLARRWTALSTTAAALTAFDPGQDIAEINDEAGELARETEERRDDQALLADQIAGLETSVAGLRAESDLKRNRAAEMKLASAALSAAEAARLAVQIRVLSREADALDMQSNRLQGRIETLRPRLRELEGEVQKLIEQRELALAFADELRASQQARAERAVAARAEAAALAERIDAIVTAIDEQRRSGAIPASDEAISSFEQASRSSDRAVRDVRSPGQLSKSAAQRRLGEVLHLRAQGHARTASLLETLSTTTPPLPEAETYAERADAERASEAEHLGRAADAYEQAASALRSTGLRGAERDALEQAAEGLEALARHLRGEPDPIDASTEDPPTEPSP